MTEKRVLSNLPSNVQNNNKIKVTYNEFTEESGTRVRWKDKMLFFADLNGIPLVSDNSNCITVEKGIIIAEALGQDDSKHKVSVHFWQVFENVRDNGDIPIKLIGSFIKDQWRTEQKDSLSKMIDSIEQWANFGHRKCAIYDKYNYYPRPNETSC